MSRHYIFSTILSCQIFISFIILLFIIHNLTLQYYCYKIVVKILYLQLYCYLITLIFRSLTIVFLFLFVSLGTVNDYKSSLNLWL